MNNIIIKSDGKLIRIPKNPFELNEHTFERGWYVVKLLNKEKEKSFKELLSMSCKYLNKKYFGMKY